MKGTLTKNSEGVWMVKWSDVHSFAHGTHWMYTELSPDSNSIRYIKDNHVMFKPLEEGLNIEFEMVAGYDNNGPDHFPKYAKILTPEEVELKDWDITLNDGLENEPYVSDDFQIGPDGAYEHTEDWTEELEEQYWKEQCPEPFATPEELERDGTYEHTEDTTPREKASELVDKFSNKCLLTTDGGKVAALIAVDEIKRILYNQDSMIRYDYWFEVKKEIEKL